VVYTVDAPFPDPEKDEEGNGVPYAVEEYTASVVTNEVYRAFKSGQTVFASTR
jgi:hypothetical protein